MGRFVCVHGHAYQPPRENPETGEVDRQPSAAPYHDWNLRISAECYGPLGRAQVLRPDGSTESRRNLWADISFDLGPTLGVWMDHHAPDIAELVADGDSAAAGHAAMAHPWVHAILPLTPARDRLTVVGWGAAEFHRRFGRGASGMWLPETAVDTASLEALADHGIGWTLVAPHQLAPENPEVGRHVPLVVELPSGRTMTVVPYDGGLSHGVAFGGLLDDGVRFAETVAAGSLDGVGPDATAPGGPGLTIVSTDIESFGHHHRFGEMALARAVQEWESMPDIELTTPGEYLRRFPATARGRLVERSSWSCAHGVERWRSDCGCRFSEVPGQDQRWRRPLRDLLDSVADVARRVIDTYAGADLIDPWAAREAYGDVLATRPTDRPAAARRFLDAHLGRSGDAVRALDWMEAERLRLEGWSSCAWFFDTPDRIETQQSLDQVRVAMATMERLTGRPMTSWYLDAVAQAGLVLSPDGG